MSGAALLALIVVGLGIVVAATRRRWDASRRAQVHHRALETIGRLAAQQSPSHPDRTLPDGHGPQAHVRLVAGEPTQPPPTPRLRSRSLRWPAAYERVASDREEGVYHEVPSDLELPAVTIISGSAVPERGPAVTETGPAVPEAGRAVAETGPVVAETGPVVAETGRVVPQTRPSVAPETRPAVVSASPGPKEEQPIAAGQPADSEQADEAPVPVRSRLDPVVDSLPVPAVAEAETVRADALRGPSAGQGGPVERAPQSAPGPDVATGLPETPEPMLFFDDAADPVPRRPPTWREAGTTSGPRRRRSSSRPPRTLASSRSRRPNAMRAAVAAAAVLVVAAAVTLAIVLPRSHHTRPPVSSPPTTAAQQQGPPTTAVAPAPASTGPILVTTTSGYSEYRTAAPATIVLAGTGRCWVEIRQSSSNGQVLYEGILVAGESRTIAGSVWVRLGNPTEVVLTVNGQALAPPSLIPGEPYNLEFE